MNTRKTYIFLGVFFSIIFLFMSFVSFLAASVNFNSFIILALAIVSFGMYNLHPHLKNNDERASDIKKKAAYYSIIFVLLYSILLFVIIQLEVISNIFHVMNLYVSLIIITYFVSLVVVAKKN
ncbi:MULTISPECIES: hypothetical protein [Bacillaceae]|uniref:hypothetical protein n=1 Tax=Bacillaceae TaxID=186817 RepID=UPI000BFCEB4E|nr:MULTISPECIES: hypothetical protein [Bacillaceae]MCM3162698.1 hypothetical protein [Metabacillus litoralis]PGT80657.1 hypothetical protein COD11_20520 [Bacillus sp. AFS040349]